MEVTNTMGAAELLRKYLAEADPDLLRSMVQSFAEALMSAEASGLCNAEYGEVTGERVNSRNGYRSRRWDTRTGTIDLAIPKLRSGSYFPDWLIEPRRRAERALVAVVAQCYVEGVSTRRVDDVVKSMGIDRHLQVPGLRAGQVPGRDGGGLPQPAPRRRSLHLHLGGRPDPEGQRRRSDRERGRDRGHRGECRRPPGDPRVSTSSPPRTGRAGPPSSGDWWPGGCPGWLSSSPTPTRAWSTPSPRCCPGPPGSGAGSTSCATCTPGCPRRAQSMVGALIRSIFEQPDAEQVHAQHARVVEQLHERFPDAAAMLVEAEADILAFTSFPKEHWRQIWSNNPQERLNKEIRRRTDVVGIFPNRPAVICDWSVPCSPNSTTSGLSPVATWASSPWPKPDSG